MNLEELVKQLKKMNPGINFKISGENDIVFGADGPIDRIKYPDEFKLTDSMSGGKVLSNKHLGGTYIQATLVPSKETKNKRDQEKKDKETDKKKKLSKEDQYFEDAKRLFKNAEPIFGEVNGETKIVGLKDERTGKQIETTEQQINQWSFCFALSKSAIGKKDKSLFIESLDSEEVRLAHTLLNESVRASSTIGGQTLDEDFIMYTADRFLKGNTNIDKVKSILSNYLNDGNELQKKNRIEALNGYFNGMSQSMGKILNIKLGSNENERM